MGGGDVDMKKKTLSLLLALVVLCTLTACSKQETVTSSALADEAEQNIKETEAQAGESTMEPFTQCAVKPCPLGLGI